MKKIAAVFKLTKKQFLKFSNKGVTDVFYYEIDEDLYENKGSNKSINLINVSGYRVPGTWKTLQYIDAVLKNIVKKSPEIFHINGYDTYDALLKELYWSNFRVGSLYYALDQLKEDYTIEYCQPYFQGNYFKELLKWLRNSFQLLKASYKTKSILTSNVKSKYIIGFIINNDFIFNLYENLIYKFKSDDVVLFLQNNLNQINTNKIDKSGIKYFYTKELNNTKTTFKFINPVFLIINLFDYSGKNGS